MRFQFVSSAAHEHHPPHRHRLLTSSRSNRPAGSEMAMFPKDPLAHLRQSACGSEQYGKYLPD